MWDSTKIHSSFYKIDISTLFWHRVSVFHVHYASMVVDHCNKQTKSTYSFFDILPQTYKMYEIKDINARFWHKAKVYFTCIKPLLWLIPIPNMNKITLLFPPLDITTHKLYEKQYSKLAWRKMQLLYQLWITSTHSSPRYHNKDTTCMKNWP